MSVFTYQGIDLHYDDIKDDIKRNIAGLGEPLLLLAGLGYGAWSWYEQLPVLGREYRTIILDNRGAGRSDVPPGPYTIPQMAADAQALLDHLKIDAAHVLGLSLGGFIAQELVLAAPERVKSLVLGCTSFGGPRTVLMSPDDLERFRQEAADGFSVEVCRRGLDLRFSAEFIEREAAALDDFVARRIQNVSSMVGWRAQVSASWAFDAEARVGQIRCPTLVITGRDDRIVPAVNSRSLCERIPGAQRVVLPGGHLFFIERAREFNECVLDFLRASR